MAMRDTRSRTYKVCSSGKETFESMAQTQRQSVKNQTLGDINMIADTAVQMIIPTSITEDIANRVAEIVYEKIRPLLSSSSIRDDTIYDVKGLAAYLKTTEEWVRDQARNGKIPCFKSGRNWKFRKRDIDKAFK